MNCEVPKRGMASRSKLNSCKHPRTCFNLALVWVANPVFSPSDSCKSLKNDQVLPAQADETWALTFVY